MSGQTSSLLVFLIAIPAFILTIAIEWWLSLKHRKELYSISDTMTNLHLGLGQLLIGVLTKIPLLGVYHLVYLWAHSQGVPTWDMSVWWLWPIGFIVMDFAYYWFHRLSHEVNFLWAAHAVHHQSEYYNLSVALRQSWIQQIYSGFFYIPLAFIGIPTEMFFLLNALNTLSQYWIHTQFIGKLGWLESFLNTPSHHRVHHGTDEPYVDKNYAGAFIIWDRAFNSFTEEESAPRYGVIKPLRSWNPAWANFDVWSLMWQRLQKKELSFKESLLLPFKAPAWQGESETSLGIKLRTEEDYQLYAEHSSFLVYGVLMGALDILLGSLLIAIAPQLKFELLGGMVLLLLTSASIHNSLLAAKKWAINLEFIRYIIVFMLLLLSYTSTSYLSFEINPAFVWSIAIIHTCTLGYFFKLYVNQE